MHISIHHLTQYFANAPFSAIKAPGLLEDDETSLAHLSLGGFTHSSVQCLSSSIRIDGKRRCKAFFQISPEMFNLIQV